MAISSALTTNKKEETYTPSSTVQKLQNALSRTEANKPGAYQSNYQTQIDNTLNSILNREKFTYNANMDPLYQQYKNQYVTQGQNAMRDTMAQAAELTGGYGSSYATTAASQAYDNYLSQLNNVVPELYQLALDKYNMEGDTLRQNLQMIQDTDNIMYGRHRDTVGDWQTDRDYAYNRYSGERDFDYTGQWNAQQLAWEKEKAAQDQANWEREFALAQSKSTGGGSGRGKSTGGGSGRGKSTSSPYTFDSVKENLLMIEDSGDPTHNKAVSMKNLIYNAYVTGGINKTQMNTLCDQFDPTGAIYAQIQEDLK